MNKLRYEAFYVDYKDVPGSNKWGTTMFKDEEIFASQKVVYYGQVIGIVLAPDKKLAQQAAKSIKIEYEELPYILTLEEAIEKESYHVVTRQLQNGNVDEAFSNDSEYVFEGECRVGGQEHFYLETQACLVIPNRKENEFEIYSSTQNPTEAQREVAAALKMPQSHIKCTAKRLGGGFGGKESRATSLLLCASVAANKYNRPVRIMLDRDDDMKISGQRHPFLGKWKVGLDKEYRFTALQMRLYSNIGHSFDLSCGVLERACSHCENCYYFPNVDIFGRLCITNTHSNTAFRGFGAPQGMVICENMITDVAHRLCISPNHLREINFYKEHQKAPFGDEIFDWRVPEMWHCLKQKENYSERENKVKEFNEINVYKKRGISMIPTKFGISFGAKHLNQAGALVHVLIDGTVLLSHGGVEMGQGLHTKMIQICAEEFKISPNLVFIKDTSTDKVANTSPTAASASSDLNGMAVLDACKQISKRLEPYRQDYPQLLFSEIVKKAYMDRVNLSANGFYATPQIDFNWNLKEHTHLQQGKLFLYFTTGVCLCEVEIDILTGEHNVLEAVIYMDIGKPINYSIDIGQIEGAFVQGMGWATMEQTMYMPSSGKLFTQGPGNYKIPGFKDIPEILKINIIDAKEKYQNLPTIHSSKGVGEPPLFLGSAVFFAIKDAVHKTDELKFNQIEKLFMLSSRNNNNTKNEQKVTFSQLPASTETTRNSFRDFIWKKASMLSIHEESGKQKQAFMVMP